MKISSILAIIEIQLVIWSVELWLLFATLTDNANVKPIEWMSDCDPVLYQDFIKQIDKTKTYRVESEQGFNEPVYQNALVRWINFKPNYGFLTLTCQKSSGTTCDVFNIWEDMTGDLRSLRNIFYRLTSKRSQEHILHVENNGFVFNLCNQQRSLVTRFKLVPIDETDFSNHTGTICSAEYGSFLGGENCSHQSILKTLHEKANTPKQAQDEIYKFENENSFMSKKLSESLKRMLLILPIVLAVIVGIVQLLIYPSSIQL